MLRSLPATTLPLSCLLAACASLRPRPGMEDAPVPGDDLLARLAHVSQLDHLADTVHDRERCASAAALSAYLLLGGDFATAAHRHGVAEAFTFANVHRLQEALFVRSNRDGLDNGLLGRTVPEFDAAGRCTGWHLHADDEFQFVLDALDLERQPIYGPTAATLADRRAGIAAALAAAPAAVFVVGCHGGLGDGAITPIDDTHPGNHYVVVCVREGRFWLLDSWCRPGTLARRELRPDEVRTFLHENRVPPYLVRRRG